MTTNLFIALAEAQAWKDAHPGSTMSISRDASGGVVVRCSTPTVGETPGEFQQWVLSGLQVRKSLAIDPVSSEEVSPKEMVGATLSALLVHPLGTSVLVQRLARAEDSLTQAIMARAAADQVVLTRDGALPDPWPEIQPPQPPAAPPKLGFIGR